MGYRIGVLGSTHRCVSAARGQEHCKIVLYMWHGEMGQNESRCPASIHNKFNDLLSEFYDSCSHQATFLHIIELMVCKRFRNQLTFSSRAGGVAAEPGVQGTQIYLPVIMRP